MPRGGRRGSYNRFHRDDEAVPPPPPPPNVEHLRWSFPSPARRGRRNGPRSWVVDNMHRNGSPPPPRWMPHRDQFIYEDVFLNEADPEIQNSSDLCFVCGDLISNHPEVPTIHLCENDHFAVVAANGRDPGLREGSGLGARGRHRRDHDPPGILQPQVDYANIGEEGGATAKHASEEQNVEKLQHRLQDAHMSLESLNHQMQELCGRIRQEVQHNQQPGKEERGKDNHEGITEELLGELETGLKDQYQSFLDRVRAQIRKKSSSLEAEIRQINREKELMASKLSAIEGKEEELKAREREVAEMRRKVEAERAKLVKESDAEKMEVRRQWQKLNDEVKRMEDMHSLQQGRVKLDVGGVTFTTSTSTLTRDSDSMLAAMFSGRHELKQEEDGTIFIDRDGTHFRYILNFLRDGATEGSMPETQQALKELLNEAIYYQITALVEAIEERLQ